MKVHVTKWVHDFGIISLNLTPKVVSGGSFVRCPNHGSDLCAAKDRIRGKSEELVFDNFQQTVKLGVPAGEGGTVGFSLAIEYVGIEPPPKSSKVMQGAAKIQANFPFQCTPEGDVRLNRDTKSGGRPDHTGPVYFPDRALSVDIEVYPRSQKPDPPDSFMKGIPTSVWDEWMKQIRVLRLAIFARLTMSENGPGSVSVTVNNESVPIPDPLVTNRTALVGPMAIELEPVDAVPTAETLAKTAPQGLLYDVYFDIGSAELDKIVSAAGDTKHQGNALDAWIRENVVTHWDVKQALIREKLAMRVEARASATSKGLTVREHFLFNQELSKKRLDTVVKRLKKILAEQDRDIVELDTTQMKAIGASKAPTYGVEDIIERRCRISVDVADLKKTIKELFGREFGGRNLTHR
jgi:hypothetical protein